jgi:hypothetical protein
VKLKRLADGAIIEVPDAKAQGLLNSRDRKGNQLFGPVSDVETGAALTTADETAANNTVGAQVGNILNQVAGASSFGLLQDNSDAAKRLAAQHPYQTLGANIATALLPTGAENLAMNLGNKAFRVVEGSSALRTGAAAITGQLISDTASSAVTAIREDQSLADAFTDRVNPLSLVTTGLATGLFAGRANSFRNKAARLEGAAADLAAGEKGLINAQQAVDDAAIPVKKLDRDLYENLKYDLRDAAEEAMPGKSMVKDLEKQHANYTELQANVPIDEAKYARDKAVHDAAELKRSEDVLSGKVIDVKDAENASHIAKVEAEREKVYATYVKDLELKPKDFKYNPNDADPAFERFLVERGRGDLTKEASTMGSLGERWRARVESLGDDLPTTKEGMTDLWHNFAEEEGYEITKAIPKQEIGNINEAASRYAGYYPEHGLRPLDPDEAARTFELHGEIGQAGSRRMILTADQARTLTPERMITLRKSLSPEDAESLLRMASPVTRAHTLLHEAGLIRHASSDVLHAHKLGAVPTSERAALLHAETSDAFTHTFTPTKEARIRAYKNGPAPLTEADLDPTIRPYPHAPPTADYTANVQELAGKLDEVKQAVTHLKNINLPEKAGSFLNMDSRKFEKMAESVRAVKAHPDVNVANVGTRVEDSVHKALSDMGVDVDAMLATEGDVMGVLGHVRKELRDQPARIAELKKAANLELQTAKQGYKAAQEAAIANGGRATGRQGQSLVKQTAGVFGRYMGSKALMGAAIGLGFSGNGVVGALGFAAGGALGGAAGKSAISRKVMSVEAMVQKAERTAKLADTIGKVTEFARRAQGPVASAYQNIFEGKEDAFAGLFPNGKPADDSEAIYQLATEHAPAFADPASHGYKSVGDMTFTNPGLAVTVAKSIERKTHALATILPAVPPPGYNSTAGHRAPLHPEEIDRIKRGVQAITHPTDTLIGMIEATHFPQTELDLIRETNPDMYMETMFKLANELWAEDENGESFINTLDHDVQMEYMNALGLDTLPGSAPGYTAYMQQMHLTARQPKPDTQAKPFSSGAGYRAPSAESTNATNAQQATFN